MSFLQHSQFFAVVLLSTLASNKHFDMLRQIILPPPLYRLPTKGIFSQSPRLVPICLTNYSDQREAAGFNKSKQN